MNTKKTHITCIGDPNDINTWSNTPYYFLKYGKLATIFDKGLSNFPKKFKYFRYFWNIWQLLTFRKKGGFQYSDFFLSNLEKQIPEEFKKESIITFNQVFPSAQSVKDKGGKMYYYIDMSLNLLFNSKEYNISSDKKTLAKAIEKEKNNYLLAEKVVCMADFVKKDLIEFYKIDESKIHVITPGANFDIEEIFHPPIFNTKNILKCIFIGKDWKRKGLDLLVEAVEIQRSKGQNIVIETIGVPIEIFTDKKFVTHHGFIDKKTNLSTFIEIIQNNHVGILLSRSEALGISVLEFQALGIPVLGFDHQGMKDTIDNENSFKLNLTENIQDIAIEISNIYIHRDQLKFKSTNLWNNRYNFGWGKTIEKWKEILN